MVTASVLWAITKLNFNHALENLCTTDDYNFTDFLRDRVMGCFTGRYYKSSHLQMFFKVGFLGALFNRAAGLQACDFIKKRLQYRCFPVSIAKLLRTPFFTEHLRWLLLAPVIVAFLKRFQTMSFRKSYDKFHLLLIEDYEQGALQKELIIAPFIE